MTKEIQLTQGKVALVDDDMYEYLNQWKWHAHRQPNGKFYAVRTENFYQNNKRSCRTISMAHVVMNAGAGVIVDHKNKDATLDNTRQNLRNCNHTENGMNCGPRKRNKSGYKGVSWHKGCKKYMAQINKNGEYFCIGTFDSPVDAAKAYDEHARMVYGEFAWTNF